MGFLQISSCSPGERTVCACVPHPFQNLMWVTVVTMIKELKPMDILSLCWPDNCKSLIWNRNLTECSASGQCSTWTPPMWTTTALVPWSCQHHHAMHLARAQAHSFHITASGPQRICAWPKGQRRLHALIRILKHIRMCPSCCISRNAMFLAPRHAGGQPAWFLARCTELGVVLAVVGSLSLEVF